MIYFPEVADNLVDNSKESSPKTMIELHILPSSLSSQTIATTQLQTLRPIAIT